MVKAVAARAPREAQGGDTRGSRPAREKQKCFDLLDALSLSGALPIDCASLHVIIAATHCFDETLINTVVQRNVNPIEKLELSSLIVGETIHARPAQQLVRPEACAAIAKYAAPMLLPSPDAAAE